MCYIIVPSYTQRFSTCWEHVEIFSHHHCMDNLLIYNYAVVWALFKMYATCFNPFQKSPNISSFFYYFFAFVTLSSMNKTKKMNEYILFLWSAEKLPVESISPVLEWSDKVAVTDMNRYSLADIFKQAQIIFVKTNLILFIIVINYFIHYHVLPLWCMVSNWNK